jgi:glyoxylase-like metal-dependent hydrolase (beta-lactamase superfamily II)
MTNYTGDVSPGGPADVRELTNLRIAKMAVDEQMSNNAYLLTCKETGTKVLIDAAADPAALLGLVEGSLSAVVTTHQHWDHHRALSEVVAETGAEVYAGAADAEAITEQTGVAVSHRLEHGDTVAVGDQVLSVITLAGHTPGSIALLYRDPVGRPHLFTGDSLFPGGPGRTTSPEEFASLMQDLQEKVFDRLPDETWFYPGHGNDSTLGAQRPSVPEWLERGW